MQYDPEKITFFAKTDSRGKQVPFGIKAKDRTRHVYVIGKTGMGKSTLLENMAVQDIKNGEGLAFIDPHGATAETLLDYVPEHRVHDVMYFAPFDTDNPVSFNVMEDVGPDKRHLVVSGLMSVFKKVWVDVWSARMEYILQNTLLALLEYPNSTLLGVNRMLSDKEYRKAVIENISDPAVKSFWVDEFLNYNERYMQEAGDSIKNKIGQFTANPLIRNIIGQPKSSFDIRKIIDERKILIMNLSKGLVGETNANLLGSMLTTRIYLAAMSRADLSQEALKVAPNFYFYVDEFQSFANATFADILSEARKYKLNLTIAHQYIDQMEEEVRNAVFGNVGTIIVFRVGPFDAEVLETVFAPQFEATDICNLGFAQVYLTLMIDGIGSPPFSAVTLPPIEASSISCKEMVIHASRMQYARKRNEVEGHINAWHNDGRADNQKDNASSSNNSSAKKRNNGSGGNGASSSNSRKFETKTQSNRNEKTDRGEQRPQREERNGREARPKSEGNGSQSTKPASRQSIDDLRSVLRTLVENDAVKSKKENNGSQTSVQRDESKQRKDDGRDTRALETKNDRKTEEKSKKVQKGDVDGRDARDELRNALASVAEPKNLPEARKNAQGTNGDEKIKTMAANPEPVMVKNDSENALDPKKLERMMRVTTYDKPPLK